MNAVDPIVDQGEGDILHGESLLPWVRRRSGREGDVKLGEPVDQAVLEIKGLHAVPGGAS